MSRHCQFGTSTFVAAYHSNDQCGPNGLPLTPNSIKILGQFQLLKTIRHRCLCRYIDLDRSKHERLVVVQEHYNRNLRTLGKVDGKTSLRLTYEILEGLSHLVQLGLVHRCMNSDNILIDEEGHVKLSNYGFHFMTDSGKSVSFPCGFVKYLSPEVVAQGPFIIHEHSHSSPVQKAEVGGKADIWALGVIMIELLLGVSLWEDKKEDYILQKVLEFIQEGPCAYDSIIRECPSATPESIPEPAQAIIKQCLTILPSQRISAEELLKNPVFNEYRMTNLVEYDSCAVYDTRLRCKDLDLSFLDEPPDDDDDHLSKRSLEEIYYLWQLAGGDLETLLRKEGMLKTPPPVTTVPNIVTDDGEMFGQQNDRSILYDTTTTIMAMEPLRHRLREISPEAYYPLLETESSTLSSQPTVKGVDVSTDTASLPLVIREKDIEYQFHRVILYKCLLTAYPFKHPQIFKEARVDQPPLLRQYIWPALLDVEGDVIGNYNSIDKETPTATDRQIEVDIPRCHQYCDLLSSPEGHAKFKRILKAWVITHPEYVYWQGQDSLLAPFLYLNFNNEAVAYACLTNFIPKYLHKFFLKDNSAVIQEYLVVFSHLIAFHEPILSNHLNEIGFIPDLYAIPWFLTMFAHVFPLHKIFHLWDTLLLGNSSFPLFIGVAILLQLKDRLMTFGFNECILLFSDMPEIDIETVVRDSIRLFCATPKSSTYRQHARHNSPRKENNGRPNISYYSTDYHEQPQGELSMEAIPLEELRAEVCPRISAEDLIELCELTGPAQSRSPTKKNKSGKPKLLIIDVRTQEEYSRGAISGSMNIPAATAFDGDGNLILTQEVAMLNSHKPQVKVVVGNRGKGAANFASSLVRLQYGKVCILHKGVDVLRPKGLLTIPPVDF